MRELILLRVLSLLSEFRQGQAVAKLNLLNLLNLFNLFNKYLNNFYMQPLRHKDKL